MTDDCLDNPTRNYRHRCPYYDHDILSCDRTDCTYHDPTTGQNTPVTRDGGATQSLQGGDRQDPLTPVSLPGDA
jgi:hypothetical protein